MQLTSFYPRKVFFKNSSKLLSYNAINFKAKILNKMGEQFKIIEYPLILLFIVSGAVFLISTSDLVSIFLSIELQSYGCAAGEAYTAEVFILSDIFGPLTRGYLPRVITI